MARMKHPLFAALKKDNNLKLLEKTVGDQVDIFARFFGREEVVVGEVVSSKVDRDGKLLLIKNRYYTPLPKLTTQVKGVHILCCGWEFIPVWVGENCCGVVAMWRDIEASQLISQYRRKILENPTFDCPLV